MRSRPGQLAAVLARHRGPARRVRPRAGLTYLGRDPPEGTRGHALYRERYILLTPGPRDGRESVGWAEAAVLPLCALTTSMQNRRILDAAAEAAGAHLNPVVETDTVAALYAHLGRGKRSSIIAHTWLRAFGVPAGMCAIPMAGTAPRPVVGILTADRQPASILAEALLAAVRGLDLAAELEAATAG